MKVAALNALLQMDEARARPILRRVLARRDTASVCLHRKAAFLVAQQQADGTEDILLASWSSCRIGGTPDRLMPHRCAIVTEA